MHPLAHPVLARGNLKAMSTARSRPYLEAAMYDLQSLSPALCPAAGCTTAISQHTGDHASWSLRSRICNDK